MAQIYLRKNLNRPLNFTELDDNFSNINAELENLGLSDLSDVLITSGVTGDVLIYDGTQWINTQLTLDKVIDVENYDPNNIPNGSFIRWDNSQNMWVVESGVTYTENVLSVTGGIQLDTTYSGDTSPGLFYWDQDAGTAAINLNNGTTLQLGQESHYLVKNQTGNLLPDGTAVMAAGTLGNSGRILVDLMVADGTFKSQMFMGLVTHDIIDGGDGYVTAFGKVRNINTTGSSVSETWVDGDVLYLNPNIPGKLTKFEPQAPNLKTIAALVIHAHSNGILFVRPTFSSNLSDINDVETYVSDDLIDKSFLIWDGINKRWIADDATYVPETRLINTNNGITGGGNLSVDRTIGLTGQALALHNLATSGIIVRTGTGTVASRSINGGTGIVVTNGNGVAGNISISTTITQYTDALARAAISGGTGISYDNITGIITNSLPDQIVALTNGGGINITGTYPNFTIASTITQYTDALARASLGLNTVGNSGAATYDNLTGVFNIPNYTLSGLGGVPLLRQLTINGITFDLSTDRSWSVGTITSLTGEATASGSGAVSVTLSNTAVIGKTLTGLNLTGGGTISSSDSILSAFGKVQNQISAMLGGVMYQGVWNASTNTPTITSGVGTKGHYYVVSTIGNTNIDGITDWRVGDWIIFNGVNWDKVDNTDAVSSVNGQTGAVNLSTTNIGEGTNLYFTNTRAQNAISLTTTGTSGAATYISGVINIPNYTLTGLGGVPTTRTLNIAGTANQVTVVGGTQDLSANRTWTLSLPQNIHTGASPMFANLSLNSAQPVLTINSSANIAEGSKIRFTEVANFQGAYLHYEALGNRFDIGVHDASDSLLTSDVIAISIPRSTGRVGVNTITPSQQLDVNGNIRVRALATNAGDFITADANGVFSRRTAAETLTDIGAQAALTNPVTGTGITGQVSFWNGTTTQTGDNGLWWDNINKRLGIGTTSPIDTFDLRGEYNQRVSANTTSVWSLIDSAGTARARFDLDGGDASFLLRNNLNVYTIRLDSNGTSYILGNVGIGTTSPTDSLDVFSSSNNQRLIRLSHPTSPTNAAGFLGFNSDGATDNVVVTLGVQFSSDYYNVINIKRDTQDVGIGTVNPSERLHVVGNGLFTGTLEVDTVNNGVGDFLTRTAGGIITRRTAAEVVSDLGVTSNTNTVSVTGTANQVLVSGTTTQQIGSNPAWTLSLPQSIATTSNVRFANLSLNTGSVLGAITINKSVSFPNATASDADAWNNANKSHIWIGSNNNAMVFGVDNVLNSRMGWIQVGHSSITFPDVSGHLRLQPLHGNVSIGLTETPTQRLDIGGNIRVRSLATSAGDFVTADANGVFSRRTAAQTLTDIGAAPASRLLTINGTTGQITVTGGAQTLSDDRTWTISLPNAISVGGAAAEYALNLGANRTGNGFAYIDLIGDETYTDYGVRLVRNNTGPDATSDLHHRGLGALRIITREAADIQFLTTNTSRVTIGAGGGMSVISGNISFSTDFGLTWDSGSEYITRRLGADRVVIGTNAVDRFAVNSSGIETRAAATVSTPTHIPVFTADPASNLRDLVTRTTAQFLGDIGAAPESGSVNYITVGAKLTALSVGNYSGDVDLLKNSTAWATGLNKPTGANSWILSITPISQGTYGAQLGGRNQDIHFRSLENSVFAPWVRLWHSGDFNIADYSTTATNNTLYAPITGSTNYIQNQFSAAQTASLWINGQANFDGGVLRVQNTVAGANTQLTLSTLNTNALGSNSDVILSFAGNVENSFTIPRGRITLTNEGEGRGVMTFATRRGSGDDIEAMRIDSYGNVGIGTTSPANLLHIYTGLSSVSYVARFESGFINRGVKIGALATIGVIQGYNVSTAADANLSLNPTGGNVGIGTTSPTSKLELVAGAGQEGIIIRNVNNVDTFQLGHLASEDSFFQMKNNAGVVQILFRTDVGNSYIATTGNVGIGTTSPSQKLHVVGNGLFTGTLEVDTVNNGVGDFLTRTAGGIITRRTAAEVLSDIGAQAASSTGNYVPLGNTSDLQALTNTRVGRFDVGVNGSPDSVMAFSYIKIYGNASASTTLAIAEGGSGFDGAIFVRNRDSSTWKRIWTSHQFDIANYSTTATNNTLYAPITGSGNYIQNQNAIAQSANFWITGTATAAQIRLSTGVDSTIYRTDDSRRVIISGGSSATTSNGGYITLEGYDFGGTGLGGNVLIAASGTASTLITRKTRIGSSVTPTEMLDVTGNGLFSGWVQAGNLRLSGNTLSSQNTNGNITITPNGTGTVIVDKTGTGTHFLVTGGNSGAVLGRFQRTIGSTGYVDIQSASAFVGITMSNESGTDWSIANSNSVLRFRTGSIGGGTDAWRMSSSTLTGIGASTLDTDTGSLTLATRGGNGNIILSPNGTGNVGINTTSPQFRLHVLGTSSGGSTASEGILIENNNATVGEAALAFRVSSTPSSNYWFTGNNQANAYDIGYGASFANDSTALRITTDLRVGIGTVTPSEKLHVVGNGLFTGTLEVDTVNNGVGDFLTRTAGGVITRRTAAEVLSDIGASPASGSANYIQNQNSSAQTANYFINGIARHESAVVGQYIAYSATNTDTSTTNEVVFKQTAFNGTNALDIRTSTGGSTPSWGTIYSTWIRTGQAASTLYFSAGASAAYQWAILNSGSLQSNGASTIRTSTGALTLATNGGNGNINLLANGSGYVSINKTPTVTYRNLFLGGDNSSWNAGLTIQNDPTGDIWGVFARTTDGFSIQRRDSAGLNQLDTIRILNNGNFGIGTTSPSQKLHVVGNGLFSGWLQATTQAAVGVNVASKITQYGLEVRASGASAQIMFGRDGSSIGSGAIGADSGHIFSVWETGGFTRQMTITSTHNLGIGTDSPSQKLHVSGNIRVTGAYYDSNNGPGTSGQVLTSTATGTDWKSLSEITGVDGTGTTNFIAKWSDTDTITNSIIFDNGTNVGIGTTSPTHKLDVVGTRAISLDTTGGNLLFRMLPAEPWTMGNKFVGSSGTEYGGWRAFGSSNTLNYHFLGDSQITPLMVVLPSGSVGIGTTTPSERLDVQGNIRITKTLLSNQENLDVDSGAVRVIATIASATYDGAFFDYVIKKGTSLRAGTVYVVHDGTNVEFTETSTNDLGNTQDVTLSVDLSGGNIRLLATTLSNDWIIKSLVRGI